MDTSKLKKFAQFARRTLMGQVSAKLDSVLAPGAAARREYPEAMKKLEAAVARDGKGQVIERVAYIWFNRFSALRFMDANDLNPVRVVSPLSGQFQPEILAEAKAGNIDEDRVPEKIRVQVRALLDGRTPSPDAQAEAYRLLLVAICNDWHRVMPFLFERIDDYTELLLPEDLLSNASILAYLREAMTRDVCEDVEVIGWLYQFYISEKKDEVFAGLKKNVKITAENIPAATQLFTPHWIVRYLVENSLGRLWMLNRPGSRLTERMDYYIAPEEPETDFLRITSPEEIKVCDPACGSGHMLTYAFDLLCAIYEEEGYDVAEIPGLILTNNLYGIEIDERAGALAAFALTMKAAGRRKRFLRQANKNGVQPNICVLENVNFRDDELADYVKEVGRDLITEDMRETLEQFREAKNFGSLIMPKLKDVAELRLLIAEKQFENNLFLRDVHERVQTVLRMADYLSPKYQIVVANPPYAGASGLNPNLQTFAKSNFPSSKADLYAMFMERSLALCMSRGLLAMINMQSWMFLGTYEKLRASLWKAAAILNMAHLGERGFDTIGGAVVSTTAFVLEKSSNKNLVGTFVRLTDGKSEAEKSSMMQLAKSDRDCGFLYKAKTSDFQSIPGEPVAYWLSDQFRKVFSGAKRISDYADPRAGLQTSDNNRFLRFWQEVDGGKIEYECASREVAASSGAKWFPCTKGGGFRRWYGFNEYIVNWENDGKELFEFAASLYGSPTRIIKNANRYFESGLTWSSIAPAFSIRYCPPGFIFETKGSMCFPRRTEDALPLLALMNSKIVEAALKVFSPTLDFHEGPLGRVPAVFEEFRANAALSAERAIEISRYDWDASEGSWDFTVLPLLSPDYRAGTLEATYGRLRTHWQRMVDELQRLEEENNRTFIDAYGLQDELKPEVPVGEITLTCNPAYRYGIKGTEEDREQRLLADSMADLVSYAVGCMFGRYSLDVPGLILANQGEGLEEHRAKVPNPTFEPDANNVIPVLDGDWFADDIAARFRRFLRVTFGEEHFQENLAFVEEALGKDIRRYFTRDFFNDHVKRYKKRPIYWLFSSPKGTFNALIYMHRYRPDTVSVVLNDYLREFRSKLEAHRRAQETLSISGDASPAQKTKALKEIEAIARQIEELDAWERDVLFPLATKKIEIDLDDGVKANYPKFGAALKPVKGLSDADD
ncbi:BREX-1 system adenine-specific DNA-methyltransferase PglX [Martelella mediterranea]|uniref:BREX-1 system adenine-specific DNA-methyltransferase PglX n=1 Tax=Martelella mediterranea TaxID=293089 RepID=UPI001E52D525|nr:BREX-1 system adenine-specific DNA-methyltransferase PglX [Martelella mediterranea]MCD1636791.1 BREX-1 system adenine-specific DNA-methyltransferase PglX [Martelella mediterranea]